ncbi:4'-phosphopantetheinyl transferase [Stieleria maiorica]|uniref:4'-phosphopantetheinyl transferase n=1 Tax=Stieleria maiorica TaxID=2795974 RepID=A0A5B9MN33_9BACT|nr:4'-phosphopantetheinyl transferase superfamily protein [Stieleria maiorica]QEG00268.1 4'-phosphopantetheinyl transferase [Stieleria maiorica]
MRISCSESWMTVTARRGTTASTPPWPMTLRSWLTPPEIDELDCFRAPNRRRDWIGGRWCAKQLLVEMFSDADDSPLKWQILSRASARRGRRPVVYRNDVRQPIDLSLAHCASITVAAVGHNHHDLDPPEGCRIGVDAIDRTALPDSFAQAWFSTAERHRLENRRWTIAAGWAAKEAAFKACNDGEPFRPRHVQIARVTAEGCTVDYETRRTADVRLRVYDDAIIAIARTSSLVGSVSVGPQRPHKSQCWPSHLQPFSPARPGEKGASVKRAAANVCYKVENTEHHTKNPS